MKFKALLLILLCSIGVAVLIFALNPVFQKKEEPLFTPLSEEELAQCPHTEPMALRKLDECTPITLVEVPYTEPKAKSYFDKALFIGDSLTNGLEMFGTLKNATYFCATSATAAGTASNANLLNLLSSRSFERVYIMLGINEMGTPPATYAKTMGRIIDTVRNYQPSAEIYLQTILPVVPEKTWSERVFSVKNIQAANAALYALAEDKGIHLVDTYHAFADKNGRMPDGIASDGVHLYTKNYAIWCDYLLSHTT